MKTPKLSKVHRDSINLFANIVHGLKPEFLLEYAGEKNLRVPSDLRPHLARVAKEEIAHRAEVEEAMKLL
jgi:hypothetical protein